MKNDRNATFNACSLAKVSRPSLLCIQEAASDASEAAHQRCGCQLACAHAALETKLLVSQVATSNIAKKSKMSRQRLSCTVRVQ